MFYTKFILRKLLLHGMWHAIFWLLQSFRELRNLVRENWIRGFHLVRFPRENRSISPAAHLWKNQIFFRAFVCALFVLFCAENFFVCAQLEQKLFKKQIFKISGLLEKWKFKMDRSSRKWCYLFVLVCAAVFFICATTILKLGAKTPL